MKPKIPGSLSEKVFTIFKCLFVIYSTTIDVKLHVKKHKRESDSLPSITHLFVMPTTL